MNGHETIEIAVPELRRYAPDMLRVLGVPIGLADEVADTLVWTEAAVGGAVRFVQANRARLLWTPRPRLRVVSEEANESVLDACGGSLLEFGTRILHYVLVRFDDTGSRGVTVHVDQTYGQSFLPYLQHLAEQDGARLEVDVRNTKARTSRVTFKASPLNAGTVSPEVASARRAHQKAVERGLEMAIADFATVTDLFEMLRVPTSERSRTHAG